MKELLSTGFWIAYSKASGIVRDLLVISVLGVSSASDAVFLGMTIAMFFQLVAYQAGINHMLGRGGGSRFQEIFQRPLVAISLVLSTLVVVTLYWSVAYKWGDLWTVSGMFVFFAPMALFVGMGTAYCVLGGWASAQAVIMSLQNSFIVLVVGAVYLYDVRELVVLGWLIALCIATLFVPMVVGRGLDSSRGEQAEERGGERVSARSAFLIPSLGLTVALIERVFYSEIEGALAFIKILETLATSIIFVCQILVYNRVLAGFDKHIREYGELDMDKCYGLLRRSFLQSILLGLLLYVLSVAGLRLGHIYFFSHINIPGVVSSSMIFLASGYGVYMVGFILREHVERLLILMGGVAAVLNTSILVVLLTVVINWLFIEYVPISILIVSVVLLFARSFYLLFGFFRKNGIYV